MVVALWRLGNRCRAAMDVQTLRRRTLCVLRYRILIRHLLGDGTLRLAIGQRRQRRHRRPGGAGRDRGLGLFVATAEADIGEPLQQRQLGLLRMLFLWLAAGLPDFGLRRHREILEFRHPGRAGRRTFGRLRDEGFGCRRLLGLDAGGLVMIREQGRLLRDRADRDVAIGRRLDRRLLRRLNRRGDRGERRTLDIAGRTLRRRGGRGLRGSRSNLRRRLELLGAFGQPRIVGAKASGQFGQTVVGRRRGGGGSGRDRRGGGGIARDLRLLDAGGNDGDADDAVERFVEGGADDDVGVLVHFLANPGGGFVDFEQREILAAGDRDQQAAGALHR